MPEVLETVAHLLVTDENPPQDLDGLDFERCASLHNAIYKYGWLKAGFDADQFDAQARPYLGQSATVESEMQLHPSVLAFLRRAKVLTHDHNIKFFYYLDLGVMPDSGTTCFDGSEETFTLYCTFPEFGSKIDGLVYDQLTHRAILHLDIIDPCLDENSPWQKLETIFTVWIEMIQRGTIVALPDDVGKADYERTENGDWVLRKGPERDAVTGAKRISGDMRPWTIVPYALRDLEETLEVWGMAVDVIEQKMGLNIREQSEGLLTGGALDAARVPKGFAREFLMRARRPRFRFIAPGLRIPVVEDFAVQPLIASDLDISDDPDYIPSIHLFRDDASVSTRELSWFGFRRTPPPDHCLSGLYLLPCDRLHCYPQEDGCALVLPFKLENGWAKQSDCSPADRHDSLLQTGYNPYNHQHPFQLQAFIEKVYWQVQRGLWEVDGTGVAGGIEKWKEADTEEGWRDYAINLGPGAYW